MRFNKSNWRSAIFVALRPLFPFQQAQYAQVFPLKPGHFARSLLVSASPTSLPFLFSSTIRLSFCPLLHLSFYFNLSGRSGTNCLLSPPVLSDYNGSPDTRLSWGTTRLMSWPDGERYSRSLQSLVVSLLSLVSTLFVIE